MNVYQDEMKIRVIGDHNVGRRSLIIAGTVDNKFQLEDAEYINPGMVDFYFSSPSTHVITKMKLDGMPFNVNIKGILHQKNFYRLNLIFWIVMGCGIARFGRKGLKTTET